MGFTAFEEQQLAGGFPVGATLSLRPPRVAIMVPRIDGVPWQAVSESALAALAGMWGGHGNVVLPWAPGVDEQPLFWDLLHAYDPDVLATYRPALAEWVLIDRADYDRRMNHLQKQLRGFADIDEPTRTAFIEDALDEAVFDLPRDPKLDDVERRIGVLDAGDRLGFTDISGQRSAGYPFTSMSTIGPPTGPIQDPACDLGHTARLMLAAAIGRLPPFRRRELAAEQHVQTLAIERPGSWAVRLSERRRDQSGHYAWDDCRRGLAWYGQGRPDPRTVVVVGDDPMDFALYLCLHRLGTTAYWFPEHGLDQTLKRAYHERALLPDLRSLRMRKGPDHLFVVSASDHAARDQLITQLAELGSVGDPRAARPEEVLPVTPLRLFEEDNQSRQHELVLDRRGISRPLPTPLPVSVRTDEPYDLRWVTEVRVDDWPVAQQVDVATRVLRAPANSVRIADGGPAYLCPARSAFGRENLQSLTQRPSLARLTLFEQLAAMTESRGWTISASDKGTYAIQSALLFGSEERFAESIEDPDVRRALYLFLPDSQSGLQLDGRRYVTVSEIQGAVVDRSRLDELEERGVLTRGLALKCARCRQTAFYDLDSFGRKFVCNRCRFAQTHGRAQWMSGDPVWRFGLAEVVFQFLRHHGDLPILTAARHVERQRSPKSQVFEIELQSPDGIRSEHDFVVCVGGRVALGEVTSKDRLEQAAKREVERFKRLGEVAELINAREIVLGTSSEAFAPRTVARARAILNSPWRRLVILQGVVPGVAIPTST